MALVKACQLGRKIPVSAKVKGIERNINDWLAVEAVPCELFSQAKFPANREKYREFCVLRGSHSAITLHLRVF